LFEVGVACDSGLDEMEVRKPQLLQLPNNIGELLNWILHSHASECAVGRKAESCSFSSYCVDNGSGDLNAEARPLHYTSSSRVVALVTNILNGLVNQITVRGVDLYTIKTRLADAKSRIHCWISPSVMGPGVGESLVTGVALLLTKSRPWL
jgi:hypothetical protein